MNEGNDQPGAGEKQDLESVLRGAKHKIALIEEVVSKAVKDAGLQPPNEQPDPSRFFQSAADVQHLPMRRWLIRPLFHEDSVVNLIGNSESLKTFIAIYWICQLANAGHKVLVIANEGQRGLSKRIQAYEQHFGKVATENIFLASMDFDLSNLEHVQILEASRAKTGATFIAIDTLNQTLGSFDENKASDMSLYFNAVRRIKGENAVALVIHHLNKSGDFRGSGVIKNNVDTMIKAERETEVGAEGLIKLTCEKQKDAAHFKPMYFRSERVFMPQLEEVEKGRSDYNPDDYQPEDFESLVVEEYRPNRLEKLKLSPAHTATLQVLANGTKPGAGFGYSQADITNAGNQSKGTVSKAISELLKAKLVELFLVEKNQFYRITFQGLQYLEQ